MTESLLRKHGLSVTRQRKTILELLMKAEKPMTIEQIRCSIDSVDVSTIYRTLTLFVQKALVYQTDFQRGVAYFEFQKHHHHHMSCTSCGVQEEIDMCFDIPSVSSGFHVTHHMFELFGLCKDCFASSSQ